MKKFLNYAVIIAAMLLVFTSCNQKPDNTTDTGSIAQEVDVDIVGKVKAAHANLLSKYDSDKFNYKYSCKSTVKSAGTQVDKNIYENVKFDATGENLKLSIINGYTAPKVNSSSIIYLDSNTVYYTDSSTVSKIKYDDEAKIYLEEKSHNFTSLDLGDLPVIDTVVVNADGGGYAFVFTYDAAKFSEEQYKIFSGVSTTDFDDITFTSVTLSGIINADDIITNQVLTVKYNYPSNNSTSSDSSYNSSVASDLCDAEVVIETKYDFSDTFSVEIPNGLTLSDAKDSTFAKLFGSNK